MAIRYTHLEGEPTTGAEWEQLQFLLIQLSAAFQQLHADYSRAPIDTKTGQKSYDPEQVLEMALAVLQLVEEYPELKPALGLVTAAVLSGAQEQVRQNMQLSRPEQAETLGRLGKGKLAAAGLLGVRLEDIQLMMKVLQARS